MTEPQDLDPEMVEHMRVLSLTHDVMDQYREVVLTALVDSQVMVDQGVDEDHDVQQGCAALASEISPPLLAERFMFGDNLMLDIALRLQEDVMAIWEAVERDDQRKKKKRDLSKKRRRDFLSYAEGIADVSEAIMDRITNPVCENCGTHVLPPQTEEH